jgi:hypothetical protein
MEYGKLEKKNEELEGGWKGVREKMEWLTKRQKNLMQK